MPRPKCQLPESSCLAPSTRLLLPVQPLESHWLRTPTESSVEFEQEVLDECGLAQVGFDAIQTPPFCSSHRFQRFSFDLIRVTATQAPRRGWKILLSVTQGWGPPWASDLPLKVPPSVSSNRWPALERGQLDRSWVLRSAVLPTSSKPANRR